jgi:hypothetical protein
MEGSLPWRPYALEAERCVACGSHFLLRHRNLEVPLMRKFEPTQENYVALRGKTVRCGRSIAVVTMHKTSSQGGSWERGFRFSSSTWGMLKRVSDGAYSMDHGKTWHSYPKEAAKSKGKLKLSGDSHGELAFAGIQKINRDYFGPGYKWKR